MAGVRARIRTRDGGAPQQAELTVTDSAGTRVLDVTADGNGDVRSEVALPAGAYTVVATAAGCGSATLTTLVTPGRETDLGTLVVAPRGGATLPAAGTWTIVPDDSRVTATAQHLGIPSVRGRFTEFGGRIEIAEEPWESSVDAVIRAASIDTGNAMRDRHLRSADFLDVTTHPDITYRARSARPGGGKRSGGQPDRWTVDGQLAFHGLVRDVALDLSYLGTGPDAAGRERARFRATTELRRHDFATTYSGVVAAGIAAIGTTLRVELEITAMREESYVGDGPRVPEEPAGG